MIRDFINEIYFNQNILKEMRKSFFDEKVIKLDGFLKKEIFNELIKLLNDVNGEKVIAADKHSYEEMGDLSGVGKLFSSGEFLDFVSIITGNKFDGIELKIRKFGSGDYSLLHDDLSRKGIDFFFIFADKWDGKFGGQIVYTDNLNNGKTFIFTVIGNSFVLINKQGLGKFVKYVNHQAGKNNFLIIEGAL